MLAGQSNIGVNVRDQSGSKQWTADYASTSMFTGDSRHHINLQSVSPGTTFVQIGKENSLRVLSVGNLTLPFHMNTHSSSILMYISN